MAFNGTGTFVRIYNWVTDKANSVPITASRMDAEQDGFATGLSNCITKDGQTTITANIPMNSKKFTGLTNGNARTDSIALGQVQDGTYIYLGTTSGAADEYVASPSPAVTAYVNTMAYRVKINATNATTTPYLQLSAIGTPASDAVIKKLDDSKAEIAVEIGDMVANGLYDFQRNSANDAWILMNPEKSYVSDVENFVKSTTSVYGVSYLPNPITISNGTDTDHDIDFTAGNFNFDDGSGQVILSALTKRFDATFALGTGAGGMAEGESLPTSGTVYLFVVSNAGGSIADIIGDTSSTGDNIAADSVVVANSLVNRGLISSCETDGGGNFTSTISINNEYIDYLYGTGTFSSSNSNFQNITKDSQGNFRKYQIKSGSISIGGNSSSTITFGEAFDNLCIGAFTADPSPTTSPSDGVRAYNWSTTGFTLTNATGGTLTLPWLAIGW